MWQDDWKSFYRGSKNISYKLKKYIAPKNSKIAQIPKDTNTALRFANQKSTSYSLVSHSVPHLLHGLSKPSPQRANAPRSKRPQRAAGISQRDFQDLLCQSAKRKILWILLVMTLGWVIKENLIQSLKWRIKTHSKGKKPGQNQCGLQSWLDPHSLAVLSISAPQHSSPAPALFSGSFPVGKLQTTLSEEKGTSLSQLFSRSRIDEVSQTLSASPPLFH